MGDFVNKRRFTIDWAYCDPAGIVFNSRFFEFFDTSSWALFEAALGVKPHKMSEHFEILGVPLVDARAKFMVPAKFGDEVEMHSFIGEFRRSSFEVRHQLAEGCDQSIGTRQLEALLAFAIQQLRAVDSQGDLAGALLC